MQPVFGVSKCYTTDCEEAQSSSSVSTSAVACSSAVSHDIVDFLFENSTIRPADSNGTMNLGSSSFLCQIFDSFWPQMDFVKLRGWRFNTFEQSFRLPPRGSYHTSCFLLVARWITRNCFAHSQVERAWVRFGIWYIEPPNSLLALQASPLTARL